MANDLERKTCDVLKKYPIQQAALFGSAASGNLREDSDVGILVEPLPTMRGLDFFGLKLDLEEALDRPVDLLTFRSLKKAQPSFRANVEKEARIIYGSHE